MLLRSSLLLMLCWVGCRALAGDKGLEPRGVWSTVKGRVEFKGDVKAPAVRRHLEDVSIYERQTLQESRRGVPSRLLDTVPNHSLLIDDKTRGVANAFVYLRKKPAGVETVLLQPPKPIELVYRDRLFFPRAFIVRAGQTVRLVSEKNNVDFAIQSMINTQVHPLVLSGKPVDWIPANGEPLPIHIRSNVEPAAESWCLVIDHPYAALTEADGSFRLDNVPPGDFSLTVWHETMGYVQRRLPFTVKPDQDVELPPVLLPAERVR